MRYERSWGRTVAGGLLLLMGLVCLGLVVWNLGKDLSIWVFGRRTVGEVEALRVERVGEETEGELAFRYYVQYRYSTPSGRTFVDVSTLSVLEWGNLEEGGPVDVVYFPLYPAYSRLEESRFVPLLACAYIPLIIVAWASLGSGYTLLRPAAEARWWFDSRA